MLNFLSKYLFFPLWEIKDGAHRSSYLKELSASQWLNFDTLQNRQWEKLCLMVKYAYDHCPYYQNSYSNFSFNGVLNNWQDFRNLPILTKKDIRENTHDLISKKFNLKDLIEAKTGGSTGKALTLYFDRTCQEMRNASAIRSNRWAGWDMGSKVAAVWGNPPVAVTLKERLRNFLLDRFIYLDTMNINDDSVKKFIKSWRTYQPNILFGHAHSIYILALYLRRFEIKNIRPKGIITTSMMLLEHERSIIEQTFFCKVTNRYGCEEVGLIACECEQHHGLHLNADQLVVEFLRKDGTVANFGEEADIVVTDLINLGMPLIRYRIEDKAVASDRSCICGRGLPLIERLLGRQADFLKRIDGSLVSGISLVERTLTSIPGIEQMQIIQNELTLLQVKIVKSKTYNLESENKLKNELISVFGSEVNINIYYVFDLDKSNLGKYRFSICTI